MAMAVEDAYPSFSTERIRLKLRRRADAGPPAQRRLDYNAPFLSVRSRLAEAGHGEVKANVWKLSAELSKEPLRVPGAVPFTWEHTPGQPKQHASPPAPLSPSPPSTPSPPSLRRASPVSPPLPSPSPPPLRPKFLRSSSSTLFAPPPPPPPPLPVHRPSPLLLTRRSIKPDSSTTLSQTTDSNVQGVKGFRMVEPTEDFLQLLLARRKKAEPEEFIVADEPAKAELPVNRADNENVAKVQPAEDMADMRARGESCDGTKEVAPLNHHKAPILIVNDDFNLKENAGGEVVDAIVQRFLEDHLDIVGRLEVMAPREEQEDEKDAKQEDEAARHANDVVDVPRMDGNGNDDVLMASMSGDMAGISSGTNRAFLVNEVTTKDTSTAPTCLLPSLDGSDPTRALIKKTRHHSSKRTTSIVVLDSCHVESLRMLRDAIVRLCRKAAAASLHSVAKARRKVAPTFCSSIEVVVPRNIKALKRHGFLDHEEEAVVLHMKATAQERLVSPNTELEQQQQPFAPILSPEQEHEQTEHEQHVRSGLASSPEHGQHQTEHEEQLSSMALPPPPLPPPPPPSISPPTPSSTSVQDCEHIISLEAGLERSLPSSPQSQMQNKGSVYIIRAKEPESPALRLRVSPAVDAHAQSVGADELNEFFDASSRFGSHNSTPGRGTTEIRRTSSYRGLSKDWGSESEFLDATSTPFETPCVSISDNKSVTSESDIIQCLQFAPSSSSSCSVGSFSSKPTSKLSKRVGKSLWLDTRELNAASRKDDPLVRSFMSGELHKTRMSSSNVARKCLSGEQGSSSTSRKHTRNVSEGSMTRAFSTRAQKPASPFEAMSCKSSRRNHVIEVTPVFPSKCQKNRSMASASGLPCPIATKEEVEMGWPLGISGYPARVKISTTNASKVKEDRSMQGVIVPLPPLPPSPAGGSWLRKAMSHNSISQKQVNVRLTSVASPAKKSTDHHSHGSACASPLSKNRWEDIVKDSQINQPDHLRFSEELHHEQTSTFNSSKYYTS